MNDHHLSTLHECVVIDILDVQLLKMEEDVHAVGLKGMSSYQFEFDKGIIKRIEPLILLSYYIPDMDITETHVIQALIGVNFYFHKKVRLRFNGDLRLTKNQYNDEYVTTGSMAIIELEVKF